jgi:hypothetical protein
MNSTYVDWWVREEVEEGVYGRKRWADIAGLQEPLYEFHIPGTPSRGPRFCGLIAAIAATPGQFGLSFDRALSAKS